MRYTIRNISNLQGLSFAIHIPVKDLKDVIRNPIYREFSIPKKSGGYRKIMAPEKRLKIVQERLAQQISFFFRAPEFVYGFVKNRENDHKSIRENAAVHLKKKYVWNIDIKDFFGSITTQKVKDSLMAEPFFLQEQLAIDIALICCYNRQLPAGSPSSPILSNLVCQQLDAALLDLMKQYQFPQIQITRYADDLSFSCDAEFTEEFKLKVKLLLQQNGFEINKDKVRLYKNSQCKWVTGIKVNEKLNLDRRYIRLIRAILHDIEQNGPDHALARMRQKNEKIETKLNLFNHLKGKIYHIQFVKGKNDPNFIQFIQRYHQICEMYL